MSEHNEHTSAGMGQFVVLGLLGIMVLFFLLKVLSGKDPEIVHHEEHGAKEVLALSAEVEKSHEVESVHVETHAPVVVDRIAPLLTEVQKLRKALASQETELHALKKAKDLVELQNKTLRAERDDGKAKLALVRKLLKEEKLLATP